MFEFNIRRRKKNINYMRTNLFLQKGNVVKFFFWNRFQFAFSSNYKDFRFVHTQHDRCNPINQQILWIPRVLGHKVMLVLVILHNIKNLTNWYNIKRWDTIVNETIYYSLGSNSVFFHVLSNHELPVSPFFYLQQWTKPNFSDSTSSFGGDIKWQVKIIIQETQTSSITCIISL